MSASDSVDKAQSKIENRLMSPAVPVNQPSFWRARTGRGRGHQMTSKGLRHWAGLDKWVMIALIKSSVVWLRTIDWKISQSHTQWGKTILLSCPVLSCGCSYIAWRDGVIRLEAAASSGDKVIDGMQRKLDNIAQFEGIGERERPLEVTQINTCRKSGN